MIKILPLLLVLSACASEKIVYVEAPKEPITCIDSIKTPMDMAKCLTEYKVKY